MGLKQLRSGERTAAVGGALLLGDLYVRWYDDGREGVTAWEVFRALDVVLAASAASALGYGVLTATSRSPSLPMAGGVVTVLLSVTGAIGVGFRLAKAPRRARGAPPAAGAWVGLGAVLATAGGAWSALRDETRPDTHVPVSVEVRPVPLSATATSADASA
ncbi:MAG: hypothetical protein M3P40_00515 [Actinomycetota bacterium]|nr:hypothetical protein [Actinomycetota bacterium]